MNDNGDRSRIKAYYASFGEREWDRLERPDDGAVEFAVTSDALTRHLPPSARILDIGGGPGRYAIWLAQQGHRVTLADLSPDMLSIARREIDRSGVADAVEEVVEADVCALGRWGDGAFDAAVCLGPLYHLTRSADRELAAHELSRVVRAGGLVFAAAMPRLTFLKRTVALADERHHLSDPVWLHRLLDEGVFENEVPGRFDVGYGIRPGELEELFSRHRVEPLELLAAESLSVGVEAAVGEVLAAGGAAATAVRRLLIEHAGDPALLGMARHVLFVGRRM